MNSIALTVAGSDSGGGSGIQADLKTFNLLDVYGMSVVTAITAQNTVEITEVFHIAPELIAAQIDSVMSDTPANAVKTGMLGTEATVEIVSSKILEYKVRKLVVDPVITSSSGTSLLDDSGVTALKNTLLPLSFLILPNLQEAEILTGMQVISLQQMESAARAIFEMGSKHVLVKGGHLKGSPVDVFFDGNTIQHFSQRRIETKDSHGTGCVLSAAITGNLARGMDIAGAIRGGKSLVTKALEDSIHIGKGPGPLNPKRDTS